MPSRLLIVIPARYASTRFPGKPLARIAGVSLLERVHRLCLRVPGAPTVVVATDDSRIERHALGFGARVLMTRRDHPSGTDRAAEVARRIPCDLVVNVQGDEPLLDPRVVGRLAAALRADSSLQMATLAHPLSDAKDYDNPNAVKVVVDRKGNALYFSRAPIPFFRGWDGRRGKLPGAVWRHLGIYGYRRDFLLRYVRWPRSPLEEAENLEQLRALERGVQIRVLRTAYEALGVDVPGDVARVERVLRRRG